MLTGLHSTVQNIQYTIYNIQYSISNINVVGFSCCFHIIIIRKGYLLQNCGKMGRFIEEPCMTIFGSFTFYNILVIFILFQANYRQHNIKNINAAYQYAPFIFIFWYFCKGSFILKISQQNCLQQYINQMASESITSLTLQNYQYQSNKPYFTKGSYQVFNATQKETNVPVTIKILKGYHLELPKYLKKLKDCKSDNVIKIFETVSDTGTLVFITERVSYGNMGNALQKCERLDDADSLFMAKMILNGHIDLLRSDCNWFGTQQDIEFTDTGVKLSWNNSISYNLVNPIPKILQKFSARPQDRAGDQNLLPFPKSKPMQQLIKISKQNASQISLNPQMKKKQKLAKKKGKNWIGLKQYRNKNEYFDQYTYLAVSQQNGFLRVKIYDKGKIQPQLLALNKTKRSFTKVIDAYDDGNKTVIVSEYSNDGNLQSYVTKLKTSGVALTQQHIQFFFFSLFEPLKQIQQSALKSINMLHIRNIYIQNGIPKIGDPVPLNENTSAILVDRAEVPDFYHPDFKKQPSSRSQIFDTYSLGVLLYKLMYTEYPIFPNGKVHIPSTPNYNKRLKTTLQIFLNQGGTLKSIESRIEVSEAVVKQVKQNKQKLTNVKKEVKNNQTLQNSKRPILDNENKSENQKDGTEKSQNSEQDESQQGDKIGCCALFCSKLQLDPNKQAASKNLGVVALQQSPYRIYRICTKILLILIFYIFLFYFAFLQNLTLFLANQNLLAEYNVTIATTNYTIITTDANKFQTKYNTTNKNVASIQSMGCLISNYNGSPDYSDLLYEHSPTWLGFLVAALLAFIVILIIKIWQIYNFDLVKAIYNREHAKADFNISHWIIFNLLFCCLIFGHYYFFNFIFTGQTQPCVGSSFYFASSEALLNDRTKFNTVYLTTAVLQLAVVLLHCLMIGLTMRVKYNKIVNPIIFFGPFMIITLIIMRIGVINNYFYPNAIQDSARGGIIKSFFINGQYVNVFGIIPEILLIGQLAIQLLIDVLYWGFLDKRRKLLINQVSAASLGQV